MALSWDLGKKALLPAGLAASLLAGTASAGVFVVKYADDGAGHRQVVGRLVLRDEAGPMALARGSVERVEESSFPQYIAEHEPLGPDRIVMLKSRSVQALDAALAARGVQPEARHDRRAGRDEVQTLVDSGPVANRIDLVFMGDGYTAAEHDKFFADIRRIVDDMFRGEAFRSYLPVFNVHAVFRASAESGIGKGTPKDTAYKLYREGNTLRAIYPGDPAAARESCAAAPGCDYKIIIANDPYYGGLGGEIAVSTSSVTSGTVVLRHELGHTFGQVGEEYDAGGHFGPNVSSSLTDIGWLPWLTDPVAAGIAVKVEPMVARKLSWPWENLGNGPYSAAFSSDGSADRAKIRLSYSGVPVASEMAVTLDGQSVPYADAGTQDRVFYDVDLDRGFGNGNHLLKFEETVHDGNNWVSSVDIFEYDAGYHYDNAYVGAYPLFDESGKVDAYHSNHEDCFMRNMKSLHFCKICQQNNWHQFFATVKLIDSVEQTRTTDGGVQVSVRTQQLGQFRAPQLGGGDRLEIKWLRGGQEVPALQGRASWNLPARDATGDWEVQVQYVTPEVRQDPEGLLKDKQTLHI